MLPRLHKPTPEQLEWAAAKGHPFVATGVIDNWRIMEWTPHYLAAKYPNVPCGVACSLVEQAAKTKYKTMLLSDLVQAALAYRIDTSSDKNLYLLENEPFLADTGLGKELEEEIKKYRPPHVNEMKNLLTSNGFFLGPAGSRTGFHTDNDHRNYLCQIFGVKKWWLAPPSENKFMYPSTKYEFGGKTSLIDKWNLDHRKYPTHHRADIRSTIINPGEMIFVPRNWWHAVENLTPVSAVGWKYETLPTLFSKAPKALLLEKLHKSGLYRRGNCTCCNTLSQ